MEESFDLALALDRAAQGPTMSWDKAMEVMAKGGVVRRASAMRSKLIRPKGSDIPIIETGQEAIRLSVAVTEFGEFVRVFQGADSRCLFEPDDDDRSATDWVQLKDRRLW